MSVFLSGKQTDAVRNEVGATMNPSGTGLSVIIRD